MGIIFNGTLTWSNHIDKVYERCAHRVGILRRLRRTFPSRALRRIYVGAVLPIMGYACPVWSGGPVAKLIHLHESFCRRNQTGEFAPQGPRGRGIPKVSAIWGIAPIMDLQCKQMALKGLCECCVCCKLEARYPQAILALMSIKYTLFLFLVSLMKLKMIMIVEEILEVVWRFGVLGYAATVCEA